ncbi:hypothetical protein H2199_002369 [Coniosporium tulheliwenetii]|uniref:Uncharacterized protein n=1 Tax=Coniosporium tulheliwenetii TaxID=3383036 RepID=A0ACC2ZEX2_9PEZI|nr:hypothetical protein H2199_002369 [Cladosporium sp. JES 115]
MNHQPEVVLPPEHIKWLVDQPDHILSIQKVLIEAVQFNYTSPRSWKFKRPFHIKSLNRMRLDLLTPDVVEEIALSIDRIFGTDTKEWAEVGLSIPMWETITRVTTRVFVGVDLAHNHTYIHYSASFAMSLGQQSGMITMLIPDLLKPIFGPLLALPCRYYDWRCSQYLVPLIQSHLAAAEKTTSGHETRKADMLQLMARCAVKSSDALDRDLRSLCSRLLALNFVGIHTSSITAMNAVLNIWSAPPHVAVALREEAATVLREHDGVWTKVAVGKLVLLDSTLRESMRISAFKGRGVERLVIKKGGVILPDGTYLPKGTKIGMPVSEIHRDAAFYDDPREFVFDRFVRKAKLGLVNTTDAFLGFGHGRHACPGRFFSAHELKLMFAYILLNYDIRHLDERPKNTTMSASSIDIATLIISDPENPNSNRARLDELPADVSFRYPTISEISIRTLSTNDSPMGANIYGLLYVPDIPSESCRNASARYVPENVTRRANLPGYNRYFLTALVPWFSPECMLEYLRAADQDDVASMITYLADENMNSTMQPPPMRDSRWDLGDGGQWKGASRYPVFAIPGSIGYTLMQQTAAYSGNLSSVPHGDELIRTYPRADHARLYAEVRTSGNRATLPTLWVFLLVVLGLLLVVIGFSSLVMHFLQRRRRSILRRRIIAGEVDIEALGMKRMTVPQEVLDKMPVYTYSGPSVVEPQRSDSAAKELDNPAPNTTTPPTPTNTTVFTQPTCPICLDDFDHTTQVRELPCRHIFHPDCVDSFLLTLSSLCPMCKKSVLPPGYCPATVTNAMVRRERMMGRRRAAANAAPFSGTNPTSALFGRRQSQGTVRRVSIQPRTLNFFAGNTGGRRISSAPEPGGIEMRPQPSQPPASASEGVPPPEPPPPLNTQRRRDWARQRAAALVGPRATAENDTDAGERTRPRWKKAISRIFPGIV